MTANSEVDYDFEAFKARALASTSSTPLLVKVYPDGSTSTNAIASLSTSGHVHMSSGKRAAKKGKLSEADSAELPKMRGTTKHPAPLPTTVRPSSSALESSSVTLGPKTKKKVKLSAPGDNPPYTPSPASTLPRQAEPLPPVSPINSSAPSRSESLPAEGLSIISAKKNRVISKPENSLPAPPSDPQETTASAGTVPSSAADRKKRSRDSPPSASASGSPPAPKVKRTTTKREAAERADPSAPPTSISPANEAGPSNHRAVQSIAERYKPARPSPLGKASDTASKGSTPVTDKKAARSTRTPNPRKTSTPLPQQDPSASSQTGADSAFIGSIVEEVAITPKAPSPNPIQLSAVYNLYRKPADPEVDPAYSSSSFNSPREGSANKRRRKKLSLSVEDEDSGSKGGPEAYYGKKEGALLLAPGEGAAIESVLPREEHEQAEMKHNAPVVNGDRSINEETAHSGEAAQAKTIQSDEVETDSPAPVKGKKRADLEADESAAPAGSIKLDREDIASATFDEVATEVPPPAKASAEKPKKQSKARNAVGPRATDAALGYAENDDLPMESVAVSPESPVSDPTLSTACEAAVKTHTPPTVKPRASRSRGLNEELKTKQIMREYREKLTAQRAVAAASEAKAGSETGPEGPSEVSGQLLRCCADHRCHVLTPYGKQERLPQVHRPCL